MADPKTYSESPFYTLCGLVVSEVWQASLRLDLENLKQKYFGSKSFVLHSSNLKRILINRKRKLKSFAEDLKILLNKNHFFLLFVVVDKEKANKANWLQTTMYKRTDRIILGNLIKFLIAKGVKGYIYSEASEVEKDLILYKTFFHYLTNGMDKLSITPLNVKDHLTSLSFVTKLNNDPEEQMADLFAICGKLKMQIDSGEIKEEDLDPLDSVLFNQMKKSLFIKGKPTLPKKVKLYKAMNAFKKLP